MNIEKKKQDKLLGTKHAYTPWKQCQPNRLFEGQYVNIIHCGHDAREG